jgi:hypothetical protein
MLLLLLFLFRQLVPLMTTTMMMAHVLILGNTSQSATLM